MKKKILLVFIFLLLILSIGCQKKEDIKVSYDTFNHIDHWDQLDDIEMGLVIIYFYSPYCLVCQAIEADVLHYAYIASKSYTIYFIQSGMILDQGEPDFDIPSTPSLIIIENRVFLNYEKGPIKVVDYFKQLVESN